VRCSCDAEKVEIKILTRATLAARNAKRGYGGSSGEVWRNQRLAGVWSQAVGFVLVHLAGIWLQSL
jgi:hypothetical protein